MPHHITQAKILFVDDDPVMCRFVSSLLNQEGHQVQIANNGQEGVKRALEWLPDLILMDLMMPIMDGFRATEVLRANPHTQHIPIIAFSAASEASILTKMQAAGMNGFISKANSLVDLPRKLFTYLPSMGQSPEPSLSS